VPIAILGLSLVAGGCENKNTARQTLQETHLSNEQVAGTELPDVESAVEKRSDAEAYLIRGIGHEKKGDMDAAIADFTEAIRLNPDLAEAHYNRGVVYGSKGDKTNAGKDFARAKQLGYEP